MGTYDEISETAALLGALFYYDPAGEKAAWARAALSEPGAAQAWPYGQPDAAHWVAQAASALDGEDALAKAHEDYNRFFVGPYRLPAPPWGSVYTDPDSVVFGNETLAVRQWMRDNCVKMNLPEKEPEDQFGLMLLMASWALRNDVPDDQVRVLFEDELLPWAYRFLELFTQAAEDEHPENPNLTGPAPTPSPLYAALGHVAELTLRDWQDRFGWTPREAMLSR